MGQIKGSGGASSRERSRSPSRDADRSSTIREGDRVEAKVAGWTRYYKGKVSRVNSDGTYDITFDDGDKKRGVRKDQIKGAGGMDRPSDRDRLSTSGRSSSI